MREIPVLIVAEPGRWRDSLQVLLRTIGGIKLLSPTENLTSAQTLIAAHSPVFVVLDFNLPDSAAWILLQKIKADYSQARCLALIKHAAQRQFVQAAGADGVLLDGFTLEMLREAFERLLEFPEHASAQELSDETLDMVAGGQENPTPMNPSTVTNIFNIPGDRW